MTVSLVYAMFSLGLAVVVLIALPGPNVVFLVNQTLTLGRRKALASMLGHTVGATVLGIVLVVLLGGVVAKFPIIHDIIRVLGALVLVGLGVSYVWPRKKVAAPEALDLHTGSLADPEHTPRAARSPFLSGFLIGATNVKVVIAYSTIVPTFLPPDAHPIVGLIVLAFVPTVIGLVSDTAWIQAAHIVRGSLSTGSPAIAWITRIGGIILIVLGVMALTEQGIFAPH